MTVEKSARNREILKAVLNGQTMSEVGAAHGISRQRVHQIKEQGLQEARESLERTREKRFTTTASARH